MTQPTTWVRMVSGAWHEALEILRDGAEGRAMGQARIRCVPELVTFYDLKMQPEGSPLPSFACRQCETWRTAPLVPPRTEGDLFYTAGEMSEDPGDDAFVHQTAEAAVEDWLSTADEAHWPDDIQVTEWRRVALDRANCYLNISPLEQVLELLDDDYNGSSSAHPKTSNMLMAERDFLRVVLNQYVPYDCEIVRTWRMKVDT